MSALLVNPVWNQKDFHCGKHRTSAAGSVAAQVQEIGEVDSGERATPRSEEEGSR